MDEQPDDEQPDDFEQYRPTGPCATGCGHRATALYPLYKGPLRYEFRCACCVILGKLERAQWYASQVSTIEAEYAKARAECDGA